MAGIKVYRYIFNTAFDMGIALEGIGFSGFKIDFFSRYGAVKVIKINVTV